MIKYRKFIALTSTVVMLAIPFSSVFSQEICSMYYTQYGFAHNQPVLDYGLGAQQVRQICNLHRHAMVPVYCQIGLNNAKAFTGDFGGQKYIVYDPVFLGRIFNQYGSDAALAILAHECGHIITGINVQGNFADWSDEARADHFAGWTLARLHAGRHAIEMWLVSEAAMPDYRHPDGRTRAQVIEQGYILGGGQPFGN